MSKRYNHVFSRELAHEYQIPWVEYWTFLQTYADLTTEDGLDLFEDFLQRQSLALCIAEKIDKLEVKSDSEDSFVTANQSSNPMNSSFLNSSLFQSINGSLGQHTALSPQILEENSFLCNGFTSSPINKSTNEMEESLHLPKHNIYDYGKNYMTWSMDSSDFMQDSFHGSASPMSCLTALFSKLSLLDRSIRQKKRSMSCSSCMGERSAHSAQDKNGSKPFNSPPRAMDPISEHFDKSDINKNLEPQDLKAEQSYCNGSIPNRICEDIVEETSSDENTERSDSPVDCGVSLKQEKLDRGNSPLVGTENSTGQDKQMYREKANDSMSSSLTSEGNDTSCSDTELGEKSEPANETEVKTSIEANNDEDECSKDVVKSENETKGETQGNEVDCLTSKFQQAANVTDEGDSELLQTPERKRRISGREKPTYVHLDVVFEMNKNKTPENVFEGLFEAVNERRKSNMNLDNVDFMKYGDEVWNRDFVIDYDLSQIDLHEGLEICAAVAVVPLNMNLQEMKVFPRVPFKLTSCESLNIDDVNFNECAVIVNVKFNFVREQMKQALLVRNCFYLRSYFING